MCEKDKFNWILIVTLAFAATFFGTVIFVAQHFIRKYW